MIGPVQQPTPLPYILDPQYATSSFDVKLQVVENSFVLEKSLFWSDQIEIQIREIDSYHAITCLSFSLMLMLIVYHNSTHK